ncbi:uncharacterized protein LOC118513841 [Anopheles stephensi]|uniref:uncharacterized protein LOC118513841 n=1 Tax=Anopheles stephensi TaxID=30069 RepID=UPI0007D0EEDA|nr:uncharacterized protein LOC118513841 [Anopheles stephensi]
MDDRIVEVGRSVGRVWLQIVDFIASFGGGLKWPDLIRRISSGSCYIRWEKMRYGRLIGRTTVVAIILVVTSDAASREEPKTFPGASVVLPAVLPILGTIIPSLLPGVGPPVPGALPGVSVSHSTSIATSVHNRPIAISHSGSVSTNGNTDAGSAASAGSTHHGSVAAESSSRTTNRKTGFAKSPPLSKRWSKFFKKLG